MGKSGLSPRFISFVYDVSMRLLPRTGVIGKLAMQSLTEIDGAIGFSKSGNSRSGDWCGNDTIWRSIQDLYLIATFADKSGRMKTKPSRNFLGIVDGVVAGEGNGPLHPKTRKEGLLIGGANLVAVDLCAIGAMGHDYRKYATYGKLREPYIECEVEEFVKSIDIEGLGSDGISYNDFSRYSREQFSSPDGWGE